MPSAAPHASARPFFRTRLVLEADGDTLTLHHFERDPAGAIFGSLWLVGWMVGIVLMARGTPWPWAGREILVLAAFVGFWLLCGFAVIAAIVQHNRLIVTAESITCVSRVLVDLRRKAFPVAAAGTAIAVRARDFTARQREIVAAPFVFQAQVGTRATPLIAVRWNAAPTHPMLRDEMRELMQEGALHLGFAKLQQARVQLDQCLRRIGEAGGASQAGAPGHP